MNSYNLLNGVHATENEWLNVHILRNTWGFRGLLMSDWTSVYSVVNTANHGLDLEMPKGRYFNYENLSAAISNGLVTEKTIDLKVQHILQSLIAFGLLDREQKEASLPLDNSETRQMALEIARGGIVLLKNEDEILPLRGTTAIVGENANVCTTGGGSGNVSPYHSTSLVEGMKATGHKCIILTDDVIFELELVKQVEVGIDYILFLVAQYRDSHQTDVEMLVKINKSIDASPDLRDKKELIEQFIASISPTGDIDDEWRQYVNDQKREQFAQIVSEEHLRPEPARTFIADAFERGYVPEGGMELDGIMPPINPFDRAANRQGKIQQVLSRLKSFFLKFADIANAEF